MELASFPAAALKGSVIDAHSQSPAEYGIAGFGQPNIKVTGTGASATRLSTLLAAVSPGIAVFIHADWAIWFGSANNRPRGAHRFTRPLYSR